jgi:hypothetical protein
MPSYLPPPGPYRFSQQQIIGINHYFGQIVGGLFDEDDLRLLLIHLREFLRNGDNIAIKSQGNAGILREIGDSIAHTIRDQGEMYKRIRDVVREVAAENGMSRLGQTKFTLFDAAKIIDGLKNVLLNSGVVYDPSKIEPAFQEQSQDLKLCVVSMLHGLLFKVSYPESQTQFYVFHRTSEHIVYVRTELDLSNVQSLHELRVNARIPVYGGAMFSQCIVLCDGLSAAKVDSEAFNRTGSREGYLEAVKALRRNGQLVITKVEAGVDSTAILKVFRSCSYDTEPISRGVELRRIGP